VVEEISKAKLKKIPSRAMSDPLKNREDKPKTRIDEDKELFE
jgi:hypothetical protein